MVKDGWKELGKSFDAGFIFLCIIIILFIIFGIGEWLTGRASISSLLGFIMLALLIHRKK